MPEAAYEALEKYGRDLVGRRPGRQARPGDRPRRRDPAGDPDPVPQDRRTTRSSSATRGSARPPSWRAWPSASCAATCRRGCATRRSSRWTWARWWPGPSTGASSRSGSRRCWPRSRRAAGPDPAVRRRAAHRGRGRRGRGFDGRRQHAQADAGPRRAAHDRRDHTGRVPQAGRERRRPGAPVPAGPGRRADRGRHGLDPARTARAVRGLPRRHGSRTARWSPRPTSATATSPTGSCRTRRSTWSTRPAPGCVPRSTRCRPSWTS